MATDLNMLERNGLRDAKSMDITLYEQQINDMHLGRMGYDDHQT